MKFIKVTAQGVGWRLPGSVDVGQHPLDVHIHRLLYQKVKRTATHTHCRDECLAAQARLRTSHGRGTGRLSAAVLAVKVLLAALVRGGVHQ